MAKKKTTKKKTAKKKEEDKPVCLTEGQYWKWRHHVDKIQNAQVKNELVETRVRFLEKHVEVLRLDAEKSRKVMSNLKKELANNGIIEKEKKNYLEFRKRFEEEIGFSLEGKTIDDYTYEVYNL